MLVCTSFEEENTIVGDGRKILVTNVELRAQCSWSGGKDCLYGRESIATTLVHLESPVEMNHFRRAVAHTEGVRWSEMAPGHLVLYHPSFMSSSARRSSAADLDEHRGVQVSPDVRRRGERSIDLHTLLIVVSGP
jgi:hypothetical protein